MVDQGTVYEILTMLDRMRPIESGATGHIRDRRQLKGID
jgi:hypothetical protein